LGIDFLAGKIADLNSEMLQLRFLSGTERSNGFESQRTRQVKGKRRYGALTAFLRRNGESSREDPSRDSQESRGMVRSGKYTSPPRSRISGRRIVDSENHRVNKVSTQGKQIVVGKTETPKRRKSPELECVEPVQSPHEVIAARGVEQTVTKPQPSTRLQRAVNLVTSGDQLSDRQTSRHV
jgi:hypothetical protein